MLYFRGKDREHLFAPLDAFLRSLKSADGVFPLILVNLNN